MHVREAQVRRWCLWRTVAQDMRSTPAVWHLVRQVILVVCGILCVAGSARAEIVLEVDVGFGGVLPLGFPGPLSVRIENRSDQPFRGELAVEPTNPFSVGDSQVSRFVEVSPGAARQVFLLVEGRPGLVPLSLIVSSRDRHDYRASVGGQYADSVRSRRQIEVELEDVSSIDTARMILVLGSKGRQAASGIPVLDPDDDRARLAIGGERTSVVWLDAHLAPDTVLAYAGIDEIWWTEPDPSAMEGPGQLGALKEWVTEGGRLTLLGATRPSLLDASELKELLPLHDIELEMASYPAPTGSVGKGLILSGPRLKGTLARDAEIVPWPGREFVRSEGGHELVGPVVRRIGAGQVALALFDPFVYDVGSTRVLARFVGYASGIDLRYVRDRNHAEEGRNRFSIAQDYDPLGGSKFFRVLGNENALTPSFGLFFFLAFCFVLLIGPVDYRMLKRRGRLHWSPWTLLAYTVVFTAASLGATYLLFAPDEEVNRIAFLDLTEGLDGEERLSGVVYHGAYSPSSGDFAPRMKNVQCFGVEVSAQNRYGFFANNDRPGAGQLFLGPGMQPLDMQVPFNSLRVAAHLVAGPSTGGVAVSREERDGTPMITVYNGLGTTLTDAIVLSKRGLIEVGKVERGETRHVRGTAVLPPSVSPPEFRKARAEGPLSPFMAQSLMVRSMVASLSISRSARAAYERGESVFMAQTDALPFDDGLSDRRAGYQWIFVRKVVEDVGGS